MLKQALTDRSGATAMEFGIIGVVVFTMMFAIFDLGRYAITLHSLQMLAAESARQEIICYSPQLAGLPPTTPPTTCSGDPLSTAAKQTLFPFLYLGGLNPTVTTTTTAPHVVQASQTGFTMIMPFWPRSMNNPAVSTSLPF
jgi:hypothetical protein